MDLHYLGLLDIAERVRRQEVAPESVTRLLLERIERHEGRPHSIAYLLADSALEQARRAPGTGLPDLSHRRQNRRFSESTPGHGSVSHR